jgi:pilus assembly protein Flp/PilA
MMKLYFAAKNLLSNLLSKKDEGASLVEYGLLVGLIACVCIVVITTTGTTIQGFFTSINTALSGANV